MESGGLLIRIGAGSTPAEPTPGGVHRAAEGSGLLIRRASSSIAGSNPATSTMNTYEIGDVCTVRPDDQLPRELWGWLVKWRASLCCEDCQTLFQGGRAKQHSIKLIAHHLDHNPENNTMRNGRSLCSRCHRSYHRSTETPEQRSDRLRRGWITRRRNNRAESPFARMTAEELSQKAKKGAITRHVRGTENARDSMSGQFLPTTIQITKPRTA